MTPALLLLASLLSQDAPAAPAVAPSAAAEPAAASASPSLTGAPTDDYGFVAWCRGALTGHMELAQAASPEMARVREEKVRILTAGKSEAEAAKVRETVAKESAREAELDAEQRKAGEEYLALYKSALDAAEAAGSPRTAGEEATGQGYRIWSAARASEPKTQMYSYLMWELPGRCETSAKSLKERSGLLGAAFKRADAAPASEPPAEPAATPAPSAPEPSAPEPSAAPAADAPVEATAPSTTPAPEDTPAPAPPLRPAAPAPGA